MESDRNFTDYTYTLFVLHIVAFANSFAIRHPSAWLHYGFQAWSTKHGVNFPTIRGQVLRGLFAWT